jgi:cell wall-associated NlpC family hydrolase
MTLNISKTQHNHDPQPEVSVRSVQNRLLARGFSVGPYGADGRYGDATEQSVRRFQNKYLGVNEVDGVVGPKTWGMLAKSTTAPTATSASKFADLAYRLVTQGIDGTRPVYRFGAEARLTDPSPDALDCSELVQWAVYQLTKNAWIDGSAAQYSGSAGHHISVTEGIRTKGALLFLSGSGSPNGIHHVVISMGNGHTAEARSTKAGCGSWPATGRGFQYATKIPVLHY